jgi:hypothetical protein
MSEFEKAYIPNRYKSKLDEESNKELGSGRGLINSVLESIRQELK